MRIRSIKPEFWTSEDVAALTWPTRLLFIGLWSYVDDNGVGRDNPKLIKADLFPLEDDPRETLATVSRGLQELSEGGQITRYTVARKDFLCINAWSSHQRIDKPNKARYPDLTCENVVIRESVATSSRESREIPAPGAGEQGNRGTEEQGKTHTTTDVVAAPAKAVAVREMSTEGFSEFWDAYGKKVGRGAAEKAFAKAVKKVSSDRIVAAAHDHAAWHQRNRTEERFIPHPTTWLNEERWQDERSERTQAPISRQQAETDAVFDAAMQRAIERERNAG